MCKNFWGRDPDSPYPPVCEDRATVIDAEATAASSPSTQKFPRSGQTFTEPDPPKTGDESTAPKEELKPLGSSFPPPKGPKDDTEAKKVPDGKVKVNDVGKGDVPVIVPEEAIKAA